MEEVRKMNKQELIEYLVAAGDLTFMYNHTWYFISALPDDTYSCGVADSGEDIVFRTLDEALDKFIIEGKPFNEVLCDIDW